MSKRTGRLYGVKVEGTDAITYVITTSTTAAETHVAKSLTPKVEAYAVGGVEAMDVNRDSVVDLTKAAQS